MFKKDILIVDFEATGFDVEKDDPVQIGLVLLDKDTLEEKLSFSSWIYTDKELSEDMKGLKWGNIKKDKFDFIKNAPKLKEIAIEIQKILPQEYTFSSWNTFFDFSLWKRLFKELDAKVSHIHLLDLWVIAYDHLLHNSGYTGDFTSESVFQFLNLGKRQIHDALNDCRLEAETLRILEK